MPKITTNDVPTFPGLVDRKINKLTKDRALTLSQWIDNLSIGMGYGAQNQLAGLEQTVRHPIDTANALFQAVTHPVKTANALAGYVKQGVTSGPMGLGQLIGENIGLPRHRTPVMREMTAYHGSPHDFDAFDMSKIGTGEGAQAYGHGLYFSESPAIAKTYQSKVSAMKGTGTATINGKPINWDDPRQAAAFELTRHNGDRLAAADFYERTFKGSEVPRLLRSSEPLPSIDLPGKFYNVDIPDEAIAKMLDWDAPLSQQPEAVRKILKEAGITKKFKENLSNFASPQGTRGAGRGQNVYALLSHTLGGDKAASDALRAAGIPGIKYYDGGSRGAGQGTRNFVVFDDKLPKILKKE